MKRGGQLFILLIIFSFISPIVAAHVAHAEPGVAPESIWYQIFLLHDWIHPIFFLLLIYSCYYFRFFLGRMLGEPKTCMGNCSGCYKSEGWLKQYHRYFFWITLFLTFIHIGEIAPSIGIFPTLSKMDLWITISEGAYLSFALLYLGTCYHFRYFVERAAKKRFVSYRVYNGLTAINRHHDKFFWLTITAVIIRFILVAVDTGSLLQAIPGTF